MLEGSITEISPKVNLFLKIKLFYLDVLHAVLSLNQRNVSSLRNLGTYVFESVPCWLRGLGRTEVGKKGLGLHPARSKRSSN